jgi:hypothetical protein
LGEIHSASGCNDREHGDYDYSGRIIESKLGKKGKQKNRYKSTKMKAKRNRTIQRVTKRDELLGEKKQTIAMSFWGKEVPLTSGSFPFGATG